MIKLECIEELSRLAITLNPCDEVTEAKGYLSALSSYMAEHDHKLRGFYEGLMSDYYGQMLLIHAIDIALFEKGFRKHGVDFTQFENYQSTMKKYLNAYEEYDLSHMDDETEMY